MAICGICNEGGAYVRCIKCGISAHTGNGGASCFRAHKCADVIARRAERRQAEQS